MQNDAVVAWVSSTSNYSSSNDSNCLCICICITTVVAWVSSSRIADAVTATVPTSLVLHCNYFAVFPCNMQCWWKWLRTGCTAGLQMHCVGPLITFWMFLFLQDPRVGAPGEAAAAAAATITEAASGAGAEAGAEADPLMDAFAAFSAQHDLA